MTLESNEHTLIKLKTAEMSSFLDQTSSLRQLDLISDPHFQKKKKKKPWMGAVTTKDQII